MSKKFCVLLTTFDGEAYLDEQLRTLEAQSEPEISIWLSDHGSSDRSLEIAKHAQSRWTKGNFRILQNTADLTANADTSLAKAGYNFRHLILHVDSTADYFAFCDQDDIWEPDKLSAARDWLDKQPTEVPALFCSRTKLVDRTGAMIGMSPAFNKKPAFKNALVQSIAGGNTMVMNRAALELLKMTSPQIPIVVHDWWAYILITGVGGNIEFSQDAKIRYRQHSNNLIGENMSFGAKFHRLKMVLSGRFKSWNDINRTAIREVEDQFTPEAKVTLAAYDKIRSTGGLTGMWLLMRSGIYRQTFFAQLSLYFACLMKKM